MISQSDYCRKSELTAKLGAGRQRPGQGKLALDVASYPPYDPE